MIICALVELDPFDLAVELAGLGSVVLGDHRPSFAANIHGLIERVEHRHGCANAPFTDLVAVQEQGNGATACQSAAPLEAVVIQSK